MNSRIVVLICTVVTLYCSTADSCQEFTNGENEAVILKCFGCDDMDEVVE